MLPLACEVAEECGGCPQISLAAARQRLEKQSRFELLAANAGLRVPQARWLWHDTPRGYRNRIRLKMWQGVPGFFNPNKDPQCAVLEPGLRRALNQFATWARPWADRLRQVQHVELRLDEGETERLGAGFEPGVGCVFTVQPGLSESERAELDAWLSAFLPAELQHWLAGQGSPPLQRAWPVPDVYTWVPLGSFRQVNTEVNRRLVRALRDCALELGCQSFSDLYCGAGNFSLPLLAAGLLGSGVEKDPHCISALQRAASEQGLCAEHFRAAEVSPGDLRWAADGLRAELLLLNPPRAGLRDSVVPLLAQEARHVLLSCCSPESIVRDVAHFAARGYAVERVWLCDMFPHTDHLELAVHLQRVPSVA